MKVAAIVLLFVGIATAAWVRGAGDVKSSLMGDGVIDLSWRNSPGLACAKNNIDAVAKVACGGSGSAVSVAKASVNMKEGTEFAMIFDCSGNEATLNDCPYDQAGLNDCDSFIAAKC